MSVNIFDKQKGDIIQVAGNAFNNTDTVARNAIAAHEGNTVVHVTAAEKATWNAVNYSNPNLLDNPNFWVNQRRASGQISNVGYFVDRWQLTDGTVTVNADGTIILNGTIIQILENSIGKPTTASSSAGTANYDDATRIFSLTATGDAIEWAKLEIGNVATPFSPPDPASELARCQRYLQKLNSYSLYRAVYILPDYIDFSITTAVTMRPIAISIMGTPEIMPFPISPAVSGFDFVIQVYGQNQLLLRATKSAHGLEDAILRVSAGTEVLLSAEL